MRRRRHVNLHRFRSPGRHHKRALRVIAVVYLCALLAVLVSCSTAAPVRHGATTGNAR